MNSRSQKLFAPQFFKSPTKTTLYECQTSQCKPQINQIQENLGRKKIKTPRPLPRIYQRYVNKRRTLTIIGENMGDDKILWYKSISPRPKKIILKVISPEKKIYQPNYQSSVIHQNKPILCQSLVMQDLKGLSTTLSTITSPTNKVSSIKSRNFSEIKQFQGNMTNYSISQRNSFGGNLKNESF